LSVASLGSDDVDDDSSALAWIELRKTPPSGRQQVVHVANMVDKPPITSAELFPVYFFSFSDICILDILTSN
jgi:hypothetical protein